MRACALSPATVQAAVLTACRFDVLACKPGNVSIDAPGHGMQARDFLLSARAAAPILARTAIGVGQCVLEAVQATQAAVGCNTNLGILLLAAPLTRAALAPREERALRPRLAAVLQTLTVADARLAFQAIRAANPAGLGSSAEQDVAGEPSLSLHEIMGLAAPRDRIAEQYANAYAAVFDTGIPALREYCARWGSLAAAMIACYLQLLAEAPDSHIARKWGWAAADRVSRRAREVETLVKACENPARRLSIVEEFDNELKKAGVNPGTSADLTVASLMAMHLDTALKADSSGIALAADPDREGVYDQTSNHSEYGGH